jgi:hypothetical protein
MAAFVLGNGVSRHGLDPAWLQTLGPVYGCNALYRTHAPTVLVATDAPISAAIQDSGYAQGRRFYTRRPRPHSGALPVPQQYFGFSSGPIAMALAALDRQDPIYLLGFDLGPDSLGRFNNVYAGTEFYKPVGDRPTFTGNWVRQILRVAADFPQQHFVRVQGATSAAILDFDRSPNIRTMPMSEFLLAINKVEEN